MTGTLDTKAYSLCKRGNNPIELKAPTQSIKY